MKPIQKIEILQALIAMLIPNVGPLLIIIAMNSVTINILDVIRTPLLTPPLWVFALLWCFFYCVIGYASNIVFKTKEIFGEWTGLSKAALAIIDLAFVDMTAMHLIYLFYKVKHLAGHLISPYIIWLCFVTLFNYAIIQMN
ncbi:hypothetical protein NQ317_016150 [Molorchus minor]|uniref:Uncharacterized protein n=1 Tax=Molorchus minor TaxID=1323400 RepID=A0ABQ9JIK2_9CUCU|nr:hypothetical protein NQ317_016150 [Molorchus minor]